MTASVQYVLTWFDALSEPERQVVAAEILRRVPTFDFSQVDDETLSHLADDLFLTLDQQEAASEQS
jgi:hypothetical protein